MMENEIFENVVTSTSAMNNDINVSTVEHKT
jgi:hypothetical protein